jgi:ribosomal protein S18 acetylase RimI-like enzyme
VQSSADAPNPTPIPVERPRQAVQESFETSAAPTQERPLPITSNEADHHKEADHHNEADHHKEIAQPASHSPSNDSPSNDSPSNHKPTDNARWTSIGATGEVVSRTFESASFKARIDFRQATSDRPQLATVTPTLEYEVSASTINGLLQDILWHVPSPGHPVRVLTPALTFADAQPYLQAGFQRRAELTLLTKSLSAPAALAWLHRRRNQHVSSSQILYQVNRDGLRVTEGRQSDVATVVAIDQASFATTWAMDRHDVEMTLTATPKTQIHLIQDHDRVLGFSITGRAGRRGYLQRLAVHPSAQGRGLGRMLVEASSRWSSHFGVRRLVVNTETTNHAAFRLYQSSGFRPSPLGLILLERQLETGNKIHEQHQHGSESP